MNYSDEHRFVLLCPMRQGTRSVGRVFYHLGMLVNGERNYAPSHELRVPIERAQYLIVSTIRNPFLRYRSLCHWATDVMKASTVRQRRTIALERMKDYRQLKSIDDCLHVEHWIDTERMVDDLKHIPLIQQHWAAVRTEVESLGHHKHDKRITDIGLDEGTVKAILDCAAWVFDKFHYPRDSWKELLPPPPIPKTIVSADPFVRHYDDAMSFRTCSALMTLCNERGTRIDSDYRKCRMVDVSIDAELLQQTCMSVHAWFQQYKKDIGDRGHLNHVSAMEQPRVLCYEPDADFFHEHVDTWNYESSLRQVSCIVYLNDVHQGGETKFMRSGATLHPQCGRIAFFPSGFTHPHQAEPAATTKYVLVAWLTFPYSSSAHYQLV